MGRRRTPRALRFHDLGWYRVAEVLLVSSPYDAFILEQDGQLTEQVFREYSDLSLSASPRFTHAPTGEAALDMLEVRRFDLVMTMASLADIDVNDFGRRVKALRPGRPVVLLALDRKELYDLRGAIDPAAIDAVFLWSGDSKILLAIVKYIEDRENLDLDLDHGNLRVIIVVEDSPAYYSSFLGILYKELTAQALSLYGEGLNEIQRQMYMKSRPKILLATSYEEGEALFARYRKHVLAIISDVRIPRRRRRGEEPDATAGLDFVRLARRADPDLPVLLQSAEPRHAATAREVDAGFIDKRSPDLLARIRNFLTESLGFGDFIFRERADGPELARARDLRDLEEKLATIPAASFAYHAAHNHFSIWLMARSEFELAERIRPRQVSDFGGVDETRRYLIEALRDTHRRTHRGQVADFSRRYFAQDPFIRLGQGALGGKARGLAFMNQRLAELELEDLGGLTVRLPKTIVVTAEHFDRFLDRNDLRQLAYTSDDDREIVERFLAGRLDEELTEKLGFIVDQLRCPLALRSSSLLEDSMHQPLAGIYVTLMLPNNAADSAERRRELCSALKLVYASTFLRDARSYLHGTGNRVEEEKMAVILQEVVGQEHGERFYPTFAGVAHSYNFYPIGPQRAEDGVVHVALGLGRTVVDGGLALRFSPRHPGVLPPHLTAPKPLLDRSQRTFYALDLTPRRLAESADFEQTVRAFDLGVAERDGTLQAVGSVYSQGDQQIRDDLSRQGPRLVTFNNLLKHKAIPLAEAVTQLLEIGKEGLGGAVEIEFAGEMGDWGRPVERGRERRAPALYLLQVRPLAGRHQTLQDSQIRFARPDLVCASSSSLGNGVIDGIRDVVYVRPDRWQAASDKQLGNKKIAREIGRLNQELAAQQRPYLLIGPGRWGSADASLGIPVQWSQISQVKVIVEASPTGHEIEPSQGTHFFQNITALEIGYLSLPAGADKTDPDRADFLDWEWLHAQPAHRETRHLRLLRLAEAITVVLDGRRGRGVVARPGAEPTTAS